MPFCSDEKFIAQVDCDRIPQTNLPTKIASERVNEVSEIRVPPEDFAAQKFDTRRPVTPNTIMLIYSTPRSGSTMLCDLIRRTELCVPHEYFQPFQYRPYLAERWGIAIEDTPGYVRALCEHRTGPTGVLGINLHGHHLPAWQEALGHIPVSVTKFVHVHLTRRDRVAQAVSYSIAKQSNQWSSAFGTDRDPTYDFQDIRIRMRDLASMNRAIQIYLTKEQLPYIPLVYEDFVASPGQFLPQIGVREVPAVPGKIAKQGDRLNKYFIERFHRENTWLSRALRSIGVTQRKAQGEASPTVQDGLQKTNTKS